MQIFTNIMRKRNCKYTDPQFPRAHSNLEQKPRLIQPLDLSEIESSPYSSYPFYSQSQAPKEVV